MKEYSAVIVKGQIAYIARCLELGVTSQGKTEKNALKNLKEAIELYLEDEDVQKELKNNPVHKATIHKIALSA
jgi:predicted RNase H-like HicB family nuclease